MRSHQRLASATALFFLAYVFGELLTGSAPVRGAQPTGWQPLPSPGPGDITALAVHPTNPDVLFAGTDAAGAWRSTDGGASWTISDTYINHTSAAAIAPSDPNHVYLAAEWAEIFVSHDGGTTFPGDSITPPNAEDIFSLAVDPTDPETFFVSGINGAGRARIWHTHNGGNTWSTSRAVHGIPRYVAITGIAISPSDPSVIYAATRACSYWWCVGESGKGVLKSTDGGDTWSRVVNGLGSLEVNGVAVDPTNADIVYAATDAGLFKSTDGGATWFASHNGMGAIRVTAVAVSSADPSRLYAGTEQGVFRSADGGATWQRTAFPTAGHHAEVLSLAVASSDPDTLYVGTREGGVYKSTDGGITVESITSNLNDGFNIVAMAVHPTDPNILLAGTWCNGGLFRSTDGGQSWQRIGHAHGAEAGEAIDHYLMRIAFRPDNPQVVFATTGHGLWRSTDAGVTWQRLENPFMDYHVHGLAIAPSNPDVIYVGTGHGPYGWEPDFPRTSVFKSTDGGATWTEVRSGLPDTPNTSIYTIAVHPTDPNVVYVGTLWNEELWGGGTGFGIYKTTNGGLTWTAINTGLGNLNVTRVLIDPSDPSRLYASTLGGVYTSVDAGATWVKTSSGLPAGVGIFTLEFDTRAAAAAQVQSTATHLYATTVDGRIYRSLDGSATWEQMDLPLASLTFHEEPHVRSLAVGSDGTAYAAVLGVGMYKFVPEVPCSALPEDVNGDRIVDLADITRVAGHWREAVTPDNEVYNLHPDAVIDVRDVMRVVRRWGERCSSP